MVQNSFHDHRVFDAGDDFDGAAAFRAGLDVDIEHPLEALSPTHGGMAFPQRCLLPLTARFGLVAPAPPGRRHL